MNMRSEIYFPVLLQLFNLIAVYSFRLSANLESFHVKHIGSNGISKKLGKLRRCTLISSTVNTLQEAERLHIISVEDESTYSKLSRPSSKDSRTLSLMDINEKEISETQRLLELPYVSALQSLKAYHAMYGDLIMPRHFLVPEDSNNYPAEWHGADLSSTVYNMKWWQRHIKYYPCRVAELNELGFIWERLQPAWNLIFESLAVYKYEILNGGDLTVPISFTVPYGDNRWSRAHWGMPLGRCVHQIRSRHDFVNQKWDRVTQLNRLGFIWDLSEYTFQRTLLALQCYAKNEEKNSGFVTLNSKDRSGVIKPLRIPSNFVVPRGDDGAEENGWPKGLWGFPLGAKCTAIRQKELYIKNRPERQAQLVKIGFYKMGNSALGWLEVVHAAAIYSQLHDRTLDVPFKFVVPERPHISFDDIDPTMDKLLKEQQSNSFHEWPWPEQLWGLPLGQRLKDLRLKGSYLSGKDGEKRRSQLNALGFEWNPKRGRRRSMVAPQ